MKYLFELKDPNPEELEKEVGLNPGDITEVTIFFTGAVAVDTAQILSPANLTKLKHALNLHWLPRGKKIKHEQTDPI